MLVNHIASILLYPSVLLIGIVAAAVVPPGDSSEELSHSEPAKLSSIDLRPLFVNLDLPNRRQGPRGTCSVFAVTGALEYALAVKEGHGSRLSIEFLNWAGHKAVNRTVDGGFFSELWKGYETSGICTEAELPYQSTYNNDIHVPDAALESAKSRRSSTIKLNWIKEWDPHTGLTETQTLATKAVLRRRWPVLGGFRWPKAPEWRNGVLQMCPPEDVFDGHSVILVGYKDDPVQPGGGTFIIRNSGGDGADGYLPYAYVAAYMNDAAWISCTGKTPPSALENK